MQMLAAIFLHEAGHLCAMRGVGVAIQRLRLMPFGIEIQRQSSMVSYRREAFIFLCGPLVNLALFVLCRMWQGEYSLFGAINLALFLFNLMPVAPLDGGNLMNCLLRERWEAGRAAKIGLAVSGIFLIPLAFLSVYLLVAFQNITLLICCLYLAMKVVFGRGL